LLPASACGFSSSGFRIQDSFYSILFYLFFIRAIFFLPSIPFPFPLFIRKKKEKKTK